MYQNFSSFLANSLRFLNIANRVIPLVREVSPQIGKIRNTISRVSKVVNTTAQKQLPTQSEKANKQNSTLTFFK